MLSWAALQTSFNASSVLFLFFSFRKCNLWRRLTSRSVLRCFFDKPQHPPYLIKKKKKKPQWNPASKTPEPMRSKQSRRIRAFVVVKEDNLKTMSGQRFASSERGSAGRFQWVIQAATFCHQSRVVINRKPRDEQKKNPRDGTSGTGRVGPSVPSDCSAPCRHACTAFLKHVM